MLAYEMRAIQSFTENLKVNRSFYYDENDEKRTFTYYFLRNSKKMPEIECSIMFPKDLNLFSYMTVFPIT